MNIHLPAKGLLVLSILNLQSSIFNPLFALPQAQAEPCPACHGKRSLSLTPPNLGQFDGDIGVTPGQPFKSHRWDVRHPSCPLCGGTGRHLRWKPAAAPEDRTGLTECIDCLGTGIAPCAKCRKTGFIQCAKCAGNQSRKPGWMLTEEKTPGRTSRHKKKIVTPCGTCGGLGKIACPACDGYGGTACRKCSGTGFVPKKERK